jgi:hypothetical protein
VTAAPSPHFTPPSATAKLPAERELTAHVL